MSAMFTLFISETKSRLLNYPGREIYKSCEVFSRVGNSLYSFDFFYPVVLSVGFGFLSVCLSVWDFANGPCWFVREKEGLLFFRLIFSSRWDECLPLCVSFSVFVWLFLTFSLCLCLSVCLSVSVCVCVGDWVVVSLFFPGIIIRHA